MVLDGQLLNWVKDFLSGRRQRVMLNGKCSGWKIVTFWCALGFSPGAYSLHNIYVNDIPDSLQNF